MKSFGGYESQERLSLQRNVLSMVTYRLFWILTHAWESETREIIYQTLDGLHMIHDTEFTPQRLKPEVCLTLTNNQKTKPGLMFLIPEGLFKFTPSSEWWIRLQTLESANTFKTGLEDWNC